MELREAETMVLALALAPCAVENRLVNLATYMHSFVYGSKWNVVSIGCRDVTFVGSPLLFCSDPRLHSNL